MTSGSYHLVYPSVFFVPIANALSNSENSATVQERLQFYVKDLKQSSKNTTEILSYSSRTYIWFLLEPLMLLAQLHQVLLMYSTNPFNMPITSLPIPIFLPTYQQDNFVFVKVWDGRLTKLHQVLEAEYQGAPQDVVEMFTCFLTPWEVTFPETT